MSKCSNCGKRKAKRNCPALSTSICSLCCGLLREKEVHCPPSCPFLQRHKPYQDQRTMEKQQSSLHEKISQEEDIFRDEKIAWLAIHAEMPLMQYLDRDQSLTDREALLALEYAREKIEKDKGLVIMPDDEFVPMNELGEAVYQNIMNCRYEKQVIIPGEDLSYQRSERLKCLERIIMTARFFAEENPEGQNYLRQVVDRFSKINQSN